VPLCRLPADEALQHVMVGELRATL
jgi:hypothetical protein